MVKFLYQMHIMWYELDMVEETLNSFLKAKEYATIPIDVSVCFNKQTFLEQPIVDNINQRFDDLAKHPVLKDAVIIEKTNADGFFNVGDWRRDIRADTGYTIWGESDTLIPNIYFPVIENIWNLNKELKTPHVVSLASRKMWDSSWIPVEHPVVHQYEYDGKGKNNAPHPLSHDQRITQEQLDEFNNQYVDDVTLEEVYPPKLDGSMLALHPDVPKLIGDGIHMIGEDFCAQLALTVLKIPQYHLKNIIKGHNYHHPNKRTNTSTNRNEFGEVIRGGELFDKLRIQSTQLREQFIRGLISG